MPDTNELIICGILETNCGIALTIPHANLTVSSIPASIIFGKLLVIA